MTNVRKIELDAITFYSLIDEGNFFSWIEKIPCIIKHEGILEKLILNIDTAKLDRYELIELSALFVRYNIDTTSLKLLKQQFGAKWKTNLLDNHVSNG